MRFAGRSILWMGILAAAWASVAAQTNLPANRPPTPPVPVLRSPVDSFRALLVLPSAERREQLTSRTPEVREKLVAKIREYQALSPEERELRLKATELRWYLKPLLQSPATNRATQLALLPEGVRDLVAVRIAQWDKFPPAVQQMMLTNEAAPAYLVTGGPAHLPPLPTEKIRSHLTARYDRLFELTPAEQERVLNTLSDVERRQMEKTLAAFEKLTPAQRQQCLVSFARFRSLTPAEQQEFLHNAERWSQMTAAERQAWREVVSNVPRVPPLPALTRKFPPLPRATFKPGEPTSTNGG